ncbi:ABC transporter ATP-binding protein [Ancylobacter defluvii]|uniref:Spermidine/putrescine import ATP-binding protein PotA n=1 Tax=Ancylobacter defluvii TaxID=1282440 RepID=A0A9W6K185_9HYPH|nr:ABC transporter ATP-binding protein [Ancylobacter defluvii]GLK86129.1 polyamine-transporting ATPase [Ancylobacter defluvii]
MNDMSSSQALGTFPDTSRTRGARVEFDRVSKDYGELTVLHETSLTIEAGEFFALIGPSGSGKSTLLGVLAGFVPPSYGAVKVDGTDIVAVPPYRRNIGMVFQNYALFPHMSVAENIGFPLKMRGCGKGEIAERVKKALAMVRLEALGERRPAQLSGGQQQRVALARAAVYDPRLLLMDEPLGALDKNLREEMQDEIKRFQRAFGATVIYVTHDQQEAAFLADRLAVMRGGMLEQIGTPRQLYEMPGTHFVASFLGEASLLPVAEIVERHGREVTVRTQGGLVLRALAPSRVSERRAVCLRPENIAIGASARERDNHFLGVVEEAVFTTGTLRYRVRLPGTDGALTVRVPSHPGIELLPPGASVDIGWDATMAVTIAEE